MALPHCRSGQGMRGIVSHFGKHHGNPSKPEKNEVTPQIFSFREEGRCVTQSYHHRQKRETVKRCHVIHTVKYFSVIKGHTGLTHTTTWTKPENIMLRKNSGLQEALRHDSLSRKYLCKCAKSHQILLFKIPLHLGMCVHTYSCVHGAWYTCPRMHLEVKGQSQESTYVGSKDPSSDPHACTASILPTDSSCGLKNVL